CRSADHGRARRRNPGILAARCNRADGGLPAHPASPQRGQIFPGRPPFRHLLRTRRRVLMRTDPHLVRRAAALAALLLAGCAGTAHAQFSSEAGGSDSVPGASAAPSAEGREAGRSERRKRRTVDVSPYLEVGQVLSAELKGGDVLTYTTIAAGVDAAVET